MNRGKQTTIQPQDAKLTRPQLRRLLGTTERQLRSWERSGWITPLAGSPAAPAVAAPMTIPEADNDQQPCYTFAEVAALRTILRLRRNGVPASRIRSLQATLRKEPHPAGAIRAWNDVQVQNHGKRISIAYRGTRLEPLTGQLLLNFSAAGDRQKVHRIGSLRRNRRSNEVDRYARADRFFLAGLRYEEKAETIPKAIRAYQKAAELNPKALGAFINLGTIFYHQGSHEDAERCYRAALVLNPRSALVHFNLANLLEERGQLETARDHYRDAIEMDPSYPDPRFNLALIYERLGRHGKACEQWRGYLQLDQHSRWAAYARQKLDQIPLRLVSSTHPSSERR